MAKTVKLILAAEIIALAIFLIYYFFVPVESFEYGASVDITKEEKSIGFDVTNSSLIFGVLPRGAISVRYFDIQSDEKVRVRIKGHGELKSWLSVSKNNFNLLGKETISVSLKVPEFAKVGHYEGKLRISTYRTIPF